MATDGDLHFRTTHKRTFPFFSDDFFQIRDGKMFVYFFFALQKVTRKTLLNKYLYPPLSMNKNSSCLILPHPPDSSFFLFEWLLLYSPESWGF